MASPRRRRLKKALRAAALKAKNTVEAVVDVVSEAIAPEPEPLDEAPAVEAPVVKEAKPKAKAPAKKAPAKKAPKKK